LVQLRTQRTALVLYGVLLILPTLVLGGLQWNQIVQDKKSELGAVPRAADDAARRLRDTLHAELSKLLESEQLRPFKQFARLYYPGPAADAPDEPLDSPLLRAPRPAGVQAWFAFDLPEAGRTGQPELDLFLGAGPPEPASEGELEEATLTLARENLADDPMRRFIRLVDYDSRIYPLLDLAANRAAEEDAECLANQRQMLVETDVEVRESRYHLQAFESPPGVPRVAATRRVLMGAMPDMRGMNPCLHRLSNGLGLMQGFFVDPQWLFDELPRSVARNVLDPSQRFVGPGETCCQGGTVVHAEVQLADALGLELRPPLDPGAWTVRIAVDTADIEARFQRRVTRFLGVAAMLLLSLSSGMVLLLRSVARDVEQAERTENFVAAVTHELRTPLASIKLHGEMLLDGWASDPDRQREYYRRIVRETERLSTLVERVLEQARLSAGAARPYPGDLSRLVAALQVQLADAGESGGADLAFELADDLPHVLLTPEAVTSILVNLVENARKYAPVDLTQPGAEPIRVVTRALDGQVALEVLDRGPGIPESERSRIFQAFYRMGNEATRTSRGTGLGLHLVELQAGSIGAQVEVGGRPGGGAAFRVRFRPAPEEA
jgi:signal transduction histidine kinase